MTRIPAAWNTASNACVKLASRSCRTNFARVPASPRSMSRFQACWMTQDWTGCSVAPRTRTRRLPCSITARTCTFVPLSRSAVKKSSARIPCAWDRRNSAQPGPSRRGAGSIPASLRICHTVDNATMMPSPASSPWIRRYPRDSFSRASRSTTDRTVRRTSGRPERPRRDNRAHRPRTMSRCQRKSWLGSRSAATRPGARPAASRRATSATPGPATSTANEPSAARAGPPRADGAASGSRRPSTTPPAATSPAQIRPGSRRGRSASSPQAEDHRTPARTKTCPPGTVRMTEPTASRKASAQLAQVVEWPGASQPPALTEPCVTISRYTALVVLVTRRRGSM